MRIEFRAMGESRNLLPGSKEFYGYVSIETRALLAPLPAAHFGHNKVHAISGTGY